MPGIMVEIEDEKLNELLSNIKNMQMKILDFSKTTSVSLNRMSYSYGDQ